jgi:ferrous iron transport protein A
MATVLTMRRGERAIISAIDAVGDEVTARRLHEMGFDDGVDIELLHRGPVGGDPLAVKVGNMVVALRKSLAGRISVEPPPSAVPFREAAE